jgi:hypothetical protein
MTMAIRAFYVFFCQIFLPDFPVKHKKISPLRYADSSKQLKLNKVFLPTSTKNVIVVVQKKKNPKVVLPAVRNGRYLDLRRRAHSRIDRFFSLSHKTPFLCNAFQRNFSDVVRCYTRVARFFLIKLTKNGRKICQLDAIHIFQMAIKCTIFHSKTLQNWSKLWFLFWKYMYIPSGNPVLQ